MFFKYEDGNELPYIIFVVTFRSEGELTRRISELQSTYLNTTERNGELEVRYFLEIKQFGGLGSFRILC